MSMPGFTAELSLAKGRHAFRYVVPTSDLGVVSEITPQMRFALQQRRFGGDPDLGSYFRCRAAGGPDLICRFFAGLPPFTIGGLLF
jgi:hypothetical protein